MSSSVPSLRQQFLRGGALLATRQLITFAFSFGGMVALTRLIGPAAFGLYAGALGLVAVAQFVLQAGLKGCLMRRPDPDRPTFDQAFWLLAAFSLAGALALSTAGAVLGGRLDPAFGPLLGFMALSLVPALVYNVPMAMLERALDFKAVAAIEGVAVLVYYGVAVTLAFAGFGVWAPAIAWVSHMTALAAMALWRARYRPAWTWSRPLAAELLREGFSQSASGMIWQLRGLAPALLVGPFAGAAGMGQVSLAMRLVESAGFLRMIAQRLAVGAFSRLQHDREAMRRGVAQAMAMQTLALGLGLCLLVLVAPWAVPRLFGAGWEPAVAILPFVAFAYMLHGLSLLATSALYTLKRAREVALGNALHVGLFFATALWLMPEHGLSGYAAAEVVAVAGYAVTLMALSRRLGPLASGAGLVWLGALALALFTPWLGPWALVGVGVALCWPGGLAELAAIGRPLLDAVRVRRAQDQASQ